MEMADIKGKCSNEEQDAGEVEEEDNDEYDDDEEEEEEENDEESKQNASESKNQDADDDAEDDEDLGTTNFNFSAKYKDTIYIKKNAQKRASLNVASPTENENANSGKVHFN